MQKWEYSVVEMEGPISFQASVSRVDGIPWARNIIFFDYLSEMGEEGWELVTQVKGQFYFFKRLVIEDDEDDEFSL